MKSVICSHVDKNGGYPVKWKKPDTGRQVPQVPLSHVEGTKSDLMKLRVVWWLSQGEEGGGERGKLSMDSRSQLHNSSKCWCPMSQWYDCD